MKKLLTFLMIFLVSTANAISIVDMEADQEITITSTQVLPYDGVRSYMLIQNKGLVDVYLKFDTIHTATEGIKIIAGGNYEPYKVPFNSVYLVTATGTSTVVVNGGH